jgi:hypothetical protein
MADVTAAIADLLARNSGPDPVDPDSRRSPDYGIAASLDGSTLDVVLTFRKGAAYCCMEPACHLALARCEGWEPLRSAMSALDVVLPARLLLRLTCVVEDGALFFDFSRPDPTRCGWYAFKPAVSQKFHVTANEGNSSPNG